MGIKVVTQPQNEPVSLPEAKLHLRVDGEDEDTLIESLIKTAREVAETSFTWRALATQTFEYTLDQFPRERFLYLPRPPLKTVESISYKDKTGTEMVLNADRYIVDTAADPGRVVLEPEASWPDVELYPASAVRIRFTAGYDDNNIPESIKQGMLLMIGHWYENRETVIVGNVAREVPFAAEALLYPYRVWR